LLAGCPFTFSADLFGLLARRGESAVEEASTCPCYCRACLDPLVGADRFDFVKDLGELMPMRVIGMLLGIPENDQPAVRRKADVTLRTEVGKPID